VAVRTSAINAAGVVFWTRWRHRDPVRFAQELARLHREHGVSVINFADENPTVSRKAWRTILEA
jgi:anaerobic magnesium-protoporphyrin IX monomethyl ester cyclase